MLNYISQEDLATASVDMQALAQTLKVLAEPKRLAIFNLLMQGLQCNCEIVDALGVPANLISHHLRVLREAGFIEMERDALDARWVYYSINRQALIDLNTAFTTLFDPERIMPRLPICGPQGAFSRANENPLTQN